MKAAIYARVSTFDQEPENQPVELRRYVEARGWTATAYVDKGVSGSKDRGRIRFWSSPASRGGEIDSHEGTARSDRSEYRPTQTVAVKTRTTF